MKNRNWTDTLLFSAVFTVLLCAIPFVWKMYTTPDEYMAITPLLITGIAYRYGFKYALVGNILNAVLSAFIWHKLYHVDLNQFLLIFSLYAVSVATTGLFAKNIHRTLNNKRYKSVYLNIVTSLLISSILIGVVSFATIQTPYRVVFRFLIINIIYCLVIARVFPNMILTKRSRFLSSKERSKLLND